MATKTINPSTWRDGAFTALEWDGRLVFLYLLTNQDSNLLGAYKMTTKQIGYDTALGQDEATRVMEVLNSVGLVVYKDDWVIIRRDFLSPFSNPSVYQNKIADYQKLPPQIQELVEEPTSPKDRVPINRTR